MAVRDIETFVIVILENRSFDHACGYLSLDSADPPMPVDGLRDDPAWRDQFINNDHDGTPTPIHALPASTQNIADPPHEYGDIDVQINTSTRGNASPIMGGFVRSYFNADPRPHDRSLVMGYYTKEAVPVFDFFARNYAICDKWFSPLPAGTQANRLMAMSGESRIAHNVASPFDFPNQTLVYDWLSTVCGSNSWCSYQWDGLPFFSLMHRWWGRIMGSLNDQFQTGPFRRYEKFKEHWQTGGDVIPNVVFIEPKYTDDPTFSFRSRNDDHCPTGITEGQRFLADIYNTLISNKSLWQKTMLIVTYDEHGGFFDHVTPPTVPAQAGGINFKTTGVRVPTFVISPYVEPGSVFSEPLDTTAILQLLADRFAHDRVYSPAVSARQRYFKPLSTILDNQPVMKKAPAISAAMLDRLVLATPAVALNTGAPSPTSKAFGKAAGSMAALHPNEFDNA